MMHFSRRGSTLITLSALLTMSGVHANGSIFSSVLPSSYSYSNPGDLNLILLASMRDSSDGVFCNGNLKSWRFWIIHALYYGAELLRREGILPNVSIGITAADICGDSGIADMRIIELLDNFKKEDRPVVGLIIGTGSRHATAIAQLVRHYHIPQSGPWATSDELSDKAAYPYYFRLIPSDAFQSVAVMDIVSNFGWKYMSVIYQQDSYGLHAFRSIQNLAKERNICIAFSLAISYGAEKDNMETIAELSTGLLENPRARVVVSFVLSESIIDGALGLLNKTVGPGHFLFIFSDAYSGDDPEFNEMRVGSFFFSLHHGVPRDYFDYLKSYSANSITGFSINDTLLRAYVADTLQCDWIVKGVNNTQVESCYGRLNESLLHSDGPLYLAGFIDTVRMFGHSIRNLINENCPHAFTDKTLLKKCVNGSRVKEYVYKTTFNGYLENMKINKDGDGMGQYEVVQQIREGRGFKRVKVGIWDALTTSLSFSNNVTWNTEFMLDNHGIPESVCSRPCEPGHFRLLSDSPCCWVCKKCRSNEFVTVNGSACDVCKETTWPNNANNTCDEIKPVVPGWAAITRIVFKCFATIGLLLVVAIGTLYTMHRNDRIIKASSLSLSCLILSGVSLSYITVYLVLATPCPVVCSIQRQTFNCCFILIYAPILVKSSWIYRIFTAGKQGNKRPNFIGGKAQLVFSFIIISIQVAISIVTAAVLPPTPTLRQPIMIEKRVELTCDLPFYALIIPFCYNLLVVLVAAVLGYKTRKLPENFNESKCIFLSVCSTVFIWIAFMSTYFAATTAQHKIILLASSLVINATVIILCLFFTRVYALFYMDEDDMLFMTMTKTRVAPVSQISTIAS